jgi:Flp pilus assembly protein TadG
MKDFSHTKKGSSLKSAEYRPSEKGQSLVELAVVLVILLILFAGIVDLGRMIFLYLSMRDAVQEGASYASVYPTSCLQIEDRIRDFLPAHSNPFEITLTMDGAACNPSNPPNVCAGGTVAIEIITDFDITMPFLSAFTGEVIELNSSISDTIIRPICSP